MPETADAAPNEADVPAIQADKANAEYGASLWRSLNSWVHGHSAIAKTLLGVASIVLAYLIIDPFGHFRDTKRITEISDRWNASIATLGLQPLYPPSEDFNVGDILLRIAPHNVESEIAGGTLFKNLVGKSIRVGHIKLPDENEIGFTRMRMTATNPCNTNGQSGAAECKLNPIEIEESSATSGTKFPVPAIVGFPGVEINLQGSAAIDLSSLGFMSFSRKESDRVKLHIPEATTFGASPAEAFGRLLGWCATDIIGKKVCKERTARQLLASAYGGGVKIVEVAQVKGDKVKVCAFDVQVTIVTRIYLTREIKVSRNGRKLSNAATGDLRGTEKVETSTRDGEIRDYVGEFMDIDRIYDRPLVIGYRSMSVNLEQPKEEAASCPN